MKNLSTKEIKFYIVAIYIVLMSTQIVAVEGFTYSPIKVVAMLISPIFIIAFGYHRQISFALFYGVLAIFMMTLCAVLSSPSVSFQRIGYRAMFFMMFTCVTYIIQDGSIELERILKLIKGIIRLYGVILIMQIFCFNIGLTEFSMINLYGSVTMAGVFKPNGLSCEPSHSARILTVLYWGYLNLLGIQQGCKLRIKEVLKNDFITTFLFVFSMVSMGSATAMIGLLLIIVHFLAKRAGYLLFVPVIILPLLLIDVDNSSVERLQIVIQSLFSGDAAEELMEKEGSGAVRILPIINTINNLDLFNISSWIGQGSTPDTTKDFVERMFSETRYIGDVTDFGLLTYLAMLLFVYKCCIHRLFSMQSLLFLCLSTFSVGSVYYTWLMFIIFYLVNYFSKEKDRSKNVSLNMMQ